MGKKAEKKSSSGKPKLTSARMLKNRPVDMLEREFTGDLVEQDKQRSARDTTFEQAAAEVGPEHTEPPKQRELLASPEAAARPVAVQNGRMLATYVGLGLERDKDNEKLVHLDFSFPLEEAHNGHIPKKVKDAWLWLKESGNEYVRVSDIPPITLDVFLDPKARSGELHLVGAEFTKAVVQVIEETGKGAVKLVTRFAFRLRVERDKDVINWAAWNDSESIWLKMPATQKSMEG